MNITAQTTGEITRWSNLQSQYSWDTWQTEMRRLSDQTHGSVSAEAQHVLRGTCRLPRIRHEGLLWKYAHWREQDGERTDGRKLQIFTLRLRSKPISIKRGPVKQTNHKYVVDRETPAAVGWTRYHYCLGH